MYVLTHCRSSAIVQLPFDQNVTKNYLTTVIPCNWIILSEKFNNYNYSKSENETLDAGKLLKLN